MPPLPSSVLLSQVPDLSPPAAGRPLGGVLCSLSTRVLLLLHLMTYETHNRAKLNNNRWPLAIFPLISLKMANQKLILCRTHSITSLYNNCPKTKQTNKQRNLTSILAASRSLLGRRLRLWLMALLLMWRGSLWNTRFEPEHNTTQKNTNRKQKQKAISLCLIFQGSQSEIHETNLLSTALPSACC